MTEKSQPRKRGIRDAGIVVVAAALVMIPSYVGRIELNQLKIPLSIVAVTCLGIFLVGLFLFMKVLED